MIGQTNKPILRNKLQRKLRHSMTDAERLLWQALRNRQIDGVKFRRQHPFDDFILDFICLEKKLVVEVDGGQHSDSQVLDKARTEKLEEAGFHVLRFWNHEVLSQIEAVKERIWMELKKAVETHPHPVPLLEGEGEREVTLLEREGAGEVTLLEGEEAREVTSIEGGGVKTAGQSQITNQQSKIKNA